MFKRLTTVLVALATAMMITVGFSSTASADEIDAPLPDAIAADAVDDPASHPAAEILDDDVTPQGVYGPYDYVSCHLYGLAGLATGAWLWYGCVPMAGNPYLYFLVTI